uniref:Uncharacterized protein n=1 Tax=Avena sativa TaxID=4498 RepID=A0ACD5VWS3_AVESA
MESFSLLKYLRGGAVAGAGNQQRAAVPATTIAASACEEGGDVVDDDAAFFDLEFAVPGDDSAASDAEEDRVEFNFSVAGDVASGGEVVAVEPVALVSEDTVGNGKEAELATTAAEPPAASFLRPATKFRVLLLKLRKPKVAAPAEGNGAGGVSPAAAAAAKTSRFLIKFRVEDAPFVSLFTRDNSSRTSDAGAGAGAARPALQAPPQQPSEAVAITAEERRFAKEVMLKYLNKIKPLYVKVSRLRFAGGASEGEETDAEPEPEPSPSPSATPSPAPSQPRAPAPQPVVVACGVRAPRDGVPAGLKQACKRLGKSRSASSAVAAAPSPSQTPPTPTTQTQTQPQRRDDSLLQVQDGIQSAISHCKRSFNASKGSESPLLRSMTDPTPCARLDGGTADTKDGGDGA